MPRSSDYSRRRARLSDWVHTTLIAIAISCFATSPTAGATVAAGPQISAGSSEAATARFYNRDIITFHGDFMGRKPAQRVPVTEANIRRIVEKPGVPAITFKETTEGAVLLLGGEAVTIITPGDLDPLQGQTMASVREEVRQRLAEAISASERERAPGRLMRGLFHSTATLVLVIGFIWILLRSSHSLRTWMLIRLGRRAGRTSSESMRQIINGAKSLVDWFLRAVLLVLALLTAEEWIRFALGQFDYTKPWSMAMTTWLADQAVSWMLATVSAIPGIITATAIFLFARLISQIVGAMFRGVQNGRFKLFGIDQELAEPTRKLTVSGIWLFGLAMAYPYLPGASTDAFKGLSVLLGVMISLGGSSIVGQAAAGFTILYSRTMSVGELVKVGDVEGQVLQIGLFTTRIQTLTGIEVSIPNMHVLSGKLLNFSRDQRAPGMWLETTVTIGYDTPWRLVHRLLLEASRRTASVQPNPAPYVLQTALSDFYAAYLLRVHIQDIAKRLEILGELHANIQDAFNREGVQIMSPHYVADPATPKMVPPDSWE